MSLACSVYASSKRRTATVTMAKRNILLEVMPKHGGFISRPAGIWANCRLLSAWPTKKPTKRSRPTPNFHSGVGKSVAVKSTAAKAQATAMSPKRR